MKKLLILFYLALMNLLATAYTLPSSPPSGCSTSGTTTTCGSVTLGWDDTLTLTKNTTLIINGDFTINKNPSTTDIGSGKVFTLQVNGNLVSNQPFESTATVSVTGNASINKSNFVGNMSVGGNLSIAYQGKVTGNISANSYTDGGQTLITGNITSNSTITTGSSSTITGNITGTSVTLGSSTSVQGVIQGTTVDIGSNSQIGASVSSTYAIIASSSVNIASGCKIFKGISGNSLTTSSSVVIQGNIATIGATIIGSGNTITGSITANTIVLNSSSSSITGNLMSNGTIDIGSGLSITGNVSGTVIKGNSSFTINGDVNASTSLQLPHASVVNGSVISPNITLDSTGSYIRDNATTEAITLGWQSRVKGIIYCTNGTVSNGCTCVTNNSGLPFNSAGNNQCMAKSILTINDISVNEGHTSTQTATLTLSLSQALSHSLSVNYTTSDGSALAGSDYQSSNGTVTFNAGEIQKSISVKVFGDTKPENNEHFNITISTSATDVTLSKAQGVVTIIDDDNKDANYNCFFDPFNRATLGTDWNVSKANGNFLPQIVNNRFRLMSAVNNQSTLSMLSSFFPPAKNKKVTVEFDFFAYGTTSNGSDSSYIADGMVVVLSNADIAAKAGGYGGSLGYAQRCEADGFKGGWMGVGLDQFYNYSNPTECRNGGVGQRRGAVAIRGSGDGKTGYKYLAGTSAGQLIATSTGARYRVTVDGMDLNQSIVSVEVNKNDGNGFTSVLAPFDVSTDTLQAKLPSYFRVSFTSGTGGANNNYEIDNLEVCSVSFPEQTSDLVLSQLNFSSSTIFIGQSVTLSVKVKNYGPADTNTSISVTGLPKLSEWSILQSVPSRGTYDSSTGVWSIPASLVKFGEESLTLTLSPLTSGVKKVIAQATYANEADNTDNTKEVSLTVNQNTFDAWETSLSRSNAKLYTKLSNTPFSFSVGADSNLIGKLCGQIIDKTAGDTHLTSWQEQNLTNESNVTMSFSVTKSTQHAKVKIAFDVNTSKSCESMGTYYESSDGFAIRPQSFTVTPSPIRAVTQELTISANNDSGYNGNRSMITKLSSSLLFSAQCKTQSGFLKDGNTSEPIIFSFSNALASKRVSFSNVGDIRIIDENWTMIDSPNDCIKDSNANTLTNRKYGCNIEGNISVYPEHFETNQTISPSWTFFSTNHETNLTFTSTITAYVENGVKATNFQNDCGIFSDVNATLNFSLSDTNRKIYLDKNETIVPMTFLVPMTSFSQGVATLTRYVSSLRETNTTALPPLMLTQMKTTATYIDSNTTVSNDVNATFVYGRVNGLDTQKICSIPEIGTCVAKVPVYVEYYYDNNGSGGIGGIGASQSYTNSQWYIVSEPNVTGIAILSPLAGILADPWSNNRISLTYTGTTFPHQIFLTLTSPSSSYLEFKDGKEVKVVYQKELVNGDAWKGSTKAGSTGAKTNTYTPPTRPKKSTINR